MNIFNQDLKRTEKGFINKNTILKYVTEADIFELVFGYKPKEYDYVISPFRDNDTRAGCWFEYSISGKFSFVDFGSKIYIGNKQMVRIDCFDAVQFYYKLGNLYQTLAFVKKHLIDGKNITPKEYVPRIILDKAETLISFDSRFFNIEDREYWFDRYQITKSQLQLDKVFPVRSYKIENSPKFGTYSVTVKTLTYCYTNFLNGHKKLHRPNEIQKNRFITNCNNNDVGGISELPTTGKKLIITKSYKDWRVLKNQGCTSIYFQNEGMYPTLDFLLPLCQRFESVIIFFDNDNTGIAASNKISNIINSYIPNKASNLCLPIRMLSEKNISDPADLIYKEDRKTLNQFLFNNKLLL